MLRKFTAQQVSDTFSSNSNESQRALGRPEGQQRCWLRWEREVNSLGGVWIPAPHGPDIHYGTQQSYIAYKNHIADVGSGDGTVSCVLVAVRTPTSTVAWHNTLCKLHYQRLVNTISSLSPSIDV